MPDQVAANAAGTTRTPWMSANLRLRIISGAVLAAIAFALLWAGVVPFALLVLACGLAISWEWGRLVRGATFDLGFFIHALAVTVAIGLAATGYALPGIAVLAIGAITLVPLYMGRGARLSAFGVFYVGLPTVALLWLRSDEPFGFMAVLFVFAVVWASDIAAYAAGRSIGGPKLAPRVSPNKTWAGLIGALLAGAAAAALFAVIQPDLDAVRLVIIGVSLASMAQVGDLVESALKRTFGLKDASDLIPGHGGFMDRMDGLITAAVMAALLAFYVDPQAPARALMFGS
jgi:phosphatidate cytidylyltransferase